MPGEAFLPVLLQMSTPTELFKSAVLRIKEILHGQGMNISGLNSVRHICMYIMARYLTRVRVAQFGVPEKFAWENILHVAQTKEGGMQEALEIFYDANGDCLIRHFDRVFGRTDGRRPGPAHDSTTRFDVTHLGKHKEILEILDAVKIEKVDLPMDILGWVYEQHLKTGTAARELSQYYTDHLVREYMVELCRPGFKADGVPESVCDPTMGTGGFLTAFVKFYKSEYPDTAVDWAVQQKEIYGCDTNDKVVGIARMNLLLEMHGRLPENLQTHNALYGDLPLTGFDVILASMPCGVSGIKHAECCGRVKNLKIRGTKSEPLFLQLMMLSLNRGGRCAVVVPDSVLTNTPRLHVDTRKYLVNHLNLKQVVKMRGHYASAASGQRADPEASSAQRLVGVRGRDFPEVSILYFENTGPSTVIDFWEVAPADPHGDASPLSTPSTPYTETLILSVPKHELNSAFSLDVRRYQKVRPPSNSKNYPTAKLSDVMEIVTGKANKNLSDKYTVPFYGASGITGYAAEPLCTGKYTVAGKTLSADSVHYVDGPFCLSDSNVAFSSADETVMVDKYFYYWLTFNGEDMTGSRLLSNKSEIADISIPIPPRDVQNEIVDILDTIYTLGTVELTDTLKLTAQAVESLVPRDPAAPPAVKDTALPAANDTAAAPAAVAAVPAAVVATPPPPTISPAATRAAVKAAARANRLNKARRQNGADTAKDDDEKKPADDMNDASPQADAVVPAPPAPPAPRVVSTPRVPDKIWTTSDTQQLVSKSSQLTANVLQQIVVDANAQMDALMRVVTEGEFEQSNLVDICEISNGKPLKATEKQGNGLYPIMGNGTDYAGYTDTFNQEADTISVGKSGTASGFVKYHTRDYYASDCFAMDAKDKTAVNSRYLYYVLKYTDLIKANMAQFTDASARCKWGDIKDAFIPVPPMVVQEELVARMDPLDAYLGAFEKLQQTKNENAKFIIDSYFS